MLRAEVHAYLSATCRNLDCPALRIGGVADHVHLLCRLSRTMSIAQLVRELKRESSKWLKSRGGELAVFHWQEGYGAFSIGASQIEVVQQYVAEQAAHHEQRSFQEEFRGFLRKYGVEYDERYVWD